MLSADPRRLHPSSLVVHPRLLSAEHRTLIRQSYTRQQDEWAEGSSVAYVSDAKPSQILCFFCPPQTCRGTPPAVLLRTKFVHQTLAGGMQILGLRENDWV
eukprot:515787-Rhodomonas_salina.2